MCVSGKFLVRVPMDGQLTMVKVPPREIPHSRIQIRPFDQSSKFFAGRDESGRRGTTFRMAYCNCRSVFVLVIYGYIRVPAYFGLYSVCLSHRACTRIT